jgi:uncharacterized protein DUF397
MTASEWTKSSYSGGGEHQSCVEVSLGRHVTAVRDSKTPSSGHLTLSAPAWAALLVSVSRVAGVVSA